MVSVAGQLAASPSRHHDREFACAAPASCGKEACTQETGSSMLQSKSPIAPQSVVLAQSMQRLSVQMGLDAGSRLGKMLDRTVDMLMRAEGIADTEIVKKVQEDLTAQVKNSLIAQAEANKKAYEDELAKTNAIELPLAYINASLTELTEAGEAAVTCDDEEEKLVQDKNDTCTKTEETTTSLTLPQVCDVASLLPYGTESKNGSSPTVSYLEDVMQDKYLYFYIRLATELEKCSNITGGMSETSKEAKENCSNAEDEVTDKIEECNATDGKLDRKVCDAQIDAAFACDEYAKKFATSTQNLATKKTNFGTTMENMKKELKGVELMLCFLDSVGSEDTAVAVQAGVDKCNQTEPDYTQVTFTMADPKSAEACDASAQIQEIMDTYTDNLKDPSLGSYNCSTTEPLPMMQTTPEPKR